ncbi:Ger(x)C family spore germination protein [Cohnella zeiphila]|uniref:Ger(X)C family spore germination protein n=1 Tax=Cohnella zeiphila TaxID=2761120 RepID=A0A7X0VWN6_9BACL|nr:Ger(x)C family spore germination protein [Cohnella zeiphila]MBB6732592.1 Ger(x)C family spore germination protein [Cohnella zeiphila]
MRSRAAGKLSRFLALLLALLMLMMTGCSDQRIIEKIGFIRTIGLQAAAEDEGEEEEEENTGKIKVTISIPKTKEQDVIVYSTVSKTIRQAIKVFDLQNDRKIVNGQLRQIVFDTALSRKGIWKYLDTLMRDGSVGNRVHVVIAEGDLNHMLSRNFEQSGPAGEYIDNLLRTERRMGDVPDSNLYTFLRDYKDDGIEPSASILKETGNSLIVNGIALFQEDRYVGKIDAEEKIYFGMLLGNIRAGDMFLDYPDKDFVSEDSTLMRFNSSRKLKVLSVGGGAQPPKEKISLKLTGTLLEYNGGLDLESTAERHQLEDEIEKFVQLKCEAVLATMKELKSDAIGVGQHVRNAMPYAAWKRLDWPEEFARSQIEVHVDVHIKSFGKLQ